MLKVIGTTLAILLAIITRIFKRRTPPVTAAKVLEGPSQTATAVSEAQSDAEKKFGPRP